ncbi:hypothetical protein, partial [Streptomyces albidoflavus]|uniref:hypothetical protein n=1 Tax=Streptomyces albidoflavus TaxID=1886 RepID=UPI00211C83FD
MNQQLSAAPRPTSSAPAITGDSPSAVLAVLDDLYLRHHTRLTNYIDTLLAADGEEASTEDAVQDTWLRAVENTAIRDWPELRDLADKAIDQVLQARATENLLVAPLHDRTPTTNSQPTPHHLTRRPAGARPAGRRGQWWVVGCELVVGVRSCSGATRRFSVALAWGARS